MTQTLNLPNFSGNNLVVGSSTQLSANVGTAASSLPVVNASKYTTLFLLVGVPGSDLAELLPNTSTASGPSIPLTSNTILSHNQGDPVSALFGNQLKIYRAPNVNGSQPPDTNFTLLATINIDPSSDATQYTDVAGGGGYWYKYTFFNSAGSAETDLASAVAVRGNFTVNYCSLDAIRREAGFKFAPYVTDDQIEEKRQAAQDEINGALDAFYQTPLQPPINDFLKNLCIRLAAGLLRQAQYSGIADPQVNGQNMYDAAQLDLDKLVMKERVLVNKQGDSLDGPGGTGTVKGWPNSSTAGAAPSSGGAPRVFRMSDVQGKSNDQTAQNLYYGRRW